MNKINKKILALTLLATCGISKINPSTFAALNIKKVYNLNKTKNLNNKWPVWKKVALFGGLPLLGTLASFGIYKGVSYLANSRLENLPKEKIPEIIGEVNQASYKPQKRKLTNVDKEYLSWLKSLPEVIVQKVSGGMSNSWKCLLDNFENEIDLKIYVDLHDNATNWDQGYKGIDNAISFGINDAAGSQRGIFEHAMKLKNGLPFEKADAMGFFEKKKISCNLVKTFSGLELEENEVEKMNIFCPFRKYGEGKSAENLSSYVQSTFNEYKKELNEINSSKSNEFDIGIEYSQEDVNSFLSNLQRQIDYCATYEMIKKCDDELIKKLGGDDTIIDAAWERLGFSEENYRKYFEKFKEFLDNNIINNQNYQNLDEKFSKRLKKVQKTLKNAYSYLFQSPNRPENWNIPVGTRKGTKDEKIIESIVRVCQALIQTHTFRNGNTRTNTCWLLNKLLIDSGYALVILDNPKIFYACNIEMLIEGVKKGQENFKKWCDENKVEIPSGIKFL